MTKSMNLADLLKSRLEARKSEMKNKSEEVRIARLVYFVEETILAFETPNSEGVVETQGHRLADVLMDMETLHDIWWISREKFEDLVLRIITKKAAVEVFNAAFDATVQEYKTLQNQIEIQEAKLLKLREQMAYLVE